MKTKDQNVETLTLETASNLSASRTLSYKKQNILIRNHVNISLFNYHLHFVYNRIDL